MIFIIFALLAFAFILLLWSGSLLLQSWLYEQPVDRMPLRAAIAGSILALFLTGWSWLDLQNPGRFDTLLNFSQYEIQDYSEVTAIRKVGNKESKIVFTRRPGGRGTTADYFDSKQISWKRSDSEGMMVALLIKEKDKEEPTRFNAILTKDGKFPKDGLRFVEEKGSRFMGEEAIGRVYRPRTSTLLINLVINLVHLVLWIVSFWLVLRYDLWPSVGLGLAMWAFLQLAIQPVLFTQTRPRLDAQAVPMYFAESQKEIFTTPCL